MSQNRKRNRLKEQLDRVSTLSKGNYTVPGMYQVCMITFLRLYVADKVLHRK